jgi:hypothetical protein
MTTEELKQRFDRRLRKMILGHTWDVLTDEQIKALPHGAVIKGETGYYLITSRGRWQLIGGKEYDYSDGKYYDWWDGYESERYHRIA